MRTSILLFLALVAASVATAQSLPTFMFNSLQGTPVNNAALPAGKPVVVVLFDPTCDHCQKQAEWITGSAVRFKNVHFLYVTTAKADEVVPFKTKFIDGKGLNVTFALDKNYRFDALFGDSPVPSMYVYGADRKLRKAFKGNEVPVESILNALAGKP